MQPKNPFNDKSSFSNHLPKGRYHHFKDLQLIYEHCRVFFISIVRE